ncbi:MAG: SPOR domain-containing protein [Proteobacteria bacterium]|nr:SPOR domain-containing protein [Pseudomonadota bacterium]
MKAKILSQSILAITLLTSVNSCSLSKYLYKEQGTTTRIVGVNGDYKPIKLYTPRLNVEAMKEQNVESRKSEMEYKRPIIREDKSLAITKEGINQTPTLSQLTNATPQYNPPQGQVNTIPTTESFEAQQARKEAKIEYDLSNESREEKISTPVAPVKPTINKAPQVSNVQPNVVEKKEVAKAVTPQKPKEVVDNSKSSKPIFVQIGSYSSLANAKTALFKNKNNHVGKIEKITRGNRRIYRVILGPIDNKTKANNVLQKAVKTGYGDAFITKK